MTTLVSTRKANVVNDITESFTIESLISVASPLPTGAIFVYKVFDRTDPKEDVFQRVSRISDLTVLPVGRDAGLAASTGTGFEYLNYSSLLSYPDLATAVAAETELEARVNKLVEDWNTYNSEFVATSVVITFPNATPETKQALIDAYTTAKQDRVNKQKLLDEANDTLTDAQDALTDITAQVTQLTTFSSGATDRTSEMSSTRSALQTLKTAGDTYEAVTSVSSCAGSFTSDTTTFLAALAAAAAAITQASTYVTNHTTFANSISTYLSTLNTAKTAAQTTVTTAAINQTTAQQNLTNAQTTENAAAVALLAVCPSFDLSSVIVCPTV